jgi:hypothetical protein
MTALYNERDRVPPVVAPRNWPAAGAMVLLAMLAVPDRLGADQEHELPTFRHRAVVLDYADLAYNPCNDVIVPSVVETDRLRNPLGRYYMYYAPHDAPGGICLAYADAPEGPWKEYPANPLIAREWAPHHAVSHVSGPHAVWIDEERKLFVYYHGENDVTRMASTTDGIRFRYEGVAATTKMFDDISEASYARVFRYVLPGRDNRYVMLLMGNNRGTRRIYLAWSKDGRSWESRRTPLLDPPAGTNQIAQAWYFPWRDRHYLIYHGHLADSFQTANLYVSEVDANLERPAYRGLFYDHASGPPGNVAQMSPCFLLGNGKVYMYTNVGPRLHQKIAVAVAETPERAGNVSFVAEMEEVAELAMVADGQRWSRQQEAAWSDDVARARAAWKERAKTLTPEVTVDRVRSLSRWAKPQMEDYAAVPALADAVLEPIGVDKEGGKLVLEGTIDTLPSHHPIVTRWLKVYVLYDISGRKISQVTFTIRGERLE